MKNMETTCAGNDDWLEGAPWLIAASIVDDNIANDVNLDLLTVPQYGRNIDQTG
uniref:Putative DNA binding protein n=1 Tax=Citrus sinensis TaxID=2711 RepID=A9XCN2_CITSI|nr:putative DNA binding protein [Citrus sinensis]